MEKGDVPKGQTWDGSGRFPKREEEGVFGHIGYAYRR
ncbi:uncharacterized protein G2W53_010612 [Senna tora]|uniref:Uncharacterized protein n=1 Tax=Senna tora TaxID=362788 RepID=A0A834X1C1_9FABA|nr:uncharacterized protein G2W53_010612 [Senna tora]